MRMKYTLISPITGEVEEEFVTPPTKHPAEHTDWLNIRASGGMLCPHCGFVETYPWYVPFYHGPPWSMRSFPPWDCRCREDSGRKPAPYETERR